MKHSLIIVLVWLSVISANAQNVILSERFDSATYPPNGWTIENNEGNWSYSYTTFAGSDQGESKLSGYPDFFGLTRFISPEINLSDKSNISLEFLHNLAYSSSLQGNGVIGVATRSGNGSWHSVWEIDVTDNIDPQKVTIPINNADASAADFQFCFYFDGFSYIVLDWYIDDITLFSSFDHDISVKQVLGKSVFEPGSQYQAKAAVKNTGLNTESFDVVCTIYDEDNVQLFTDTKNVSELQAGLTDTIDFSSYLLENPNALYKINITSDLSEDQNPGNDTVNKNIYTYTTSRDQVLLEIGTGTWCHYCQGAALGADDLINNGKDAAIIEYHSEDDFATDTGKDRLNFYSISGFPTAYFDGTLIFSGGSESSLYDDYLPLYDEQKAVKTGVTINMSETHSNNDYTVTVDLAKVGPVADTNTVLYLVLTESDIDFPWQSLSKLNFVQRLMLPNSDGHAVDLVDSTNLSIPFNFQIDDSWTNDLEVIAFVQNLDTKEVLNSSKMNLSDPQGINDKFSAQENNFIVYPNPASNWFSFKQADNTRMDVCITDLTGRVVEQFNDVDSGKRLTISKLPKGLYVVIFKTENNSIINKKLVIK